MTAKDNAEITIRKYYTWGTNKEGQSLSWLESKELAIIEIESIIKEFNSFAPKGMKTCYWDEVKKEIELL